MHVELTGEAPRGHRRRRGGPRRARALGRRSRGDAAQRRRSSHGSPISSEPVYGVSTGFGSLATVHPARAPRRAAALADPLPRRGHGTAGRARGRARDDAAARSTLAMGSPAFGRRRRDDPRAAQRRAHAGRPRVRFARLLAATSRRSRTCALALIGEGDVRDRRRRADRRGRRARAERARAGRRSPRRRDWR